MRSSPCYMAWAFPVQYAIEKGSESIRTHACTHKHRLARKTSRTRVNPKRMRKPGIPHRQTRRHPNLSQTDKQAGKRGASAGLGPRSQKMHAGSREGVVARCRPRVALLEHVGRVLEAKPFRGQVLSLVSLWLAADRGEGFAGAKERSFNWSA